MTNALSHQDQGPSGSSMGGLVRVGARHPWRIPLDTGDLEHGVALIIDVFRPYFSDSAAAELSFEPARS